jgi:hypothetical protein
VTLKLVGYAEVVHALHDRFHERSAVVLFGGLAMVRVGAAVFLLENDAVNGINLDVDGGRMLM